MSVTNIDFTTLSLCDALDLAILIEEEAHDRYLELASQMALHHTAEAAAFFRAMADNEAKHGEHLTMQRAALFQDAAPTVTRAMLWDVEAPDYDEVRASMTQRQALDVALRAEQKARAFFVAALPEVRDAEVRKLLETLRDEEVEHERLVSAQLERLAHEPAIDPSDFEDEPVAQ